MKLEEALRELNVPFRSAGESPHVTHGWLGLVCPFCGKGTGKFGLGVNLTFHNLTCWKCGPHKLTETLIELTGRAYHELRGLIKGLERPALSSHQRLQTGSKLTLPTGVGPLLPRHRSYLQDRGFDPDQLVKLWGIGGIGIAARMGWSIFIPIQFGGATVSWTTRRIGQTVIPKYRTAKPSQEAIHHKGLLYGEDYCRGTILVLEGPTDVWRIGPGATCTFGTSFTRRQLARISAYPRRIICFDNEPTAQLRAAKICRLLSPFDGETIRVCLDSGDPGSATPREVRRLRRFLR